MRDRGKVTTVDYLKIACLPSNHVVAVKTDQFMCTSGNMKGDPTFITFSIKKGH